MNRFLKLAENWRIYLLERSYKAYTHDRFGKKYQPDSLWSILTRLNVDAETTLTFRLATEDRRKLSRGTETGLLITYVSSNQLTGEERAQFGQRLAKVTGIEYFVVGNQIILRTSCPQSATLKKTTSWAENNKFIRYNELATKELAKISKKLQSDEFRELENEMKQKIKSKSEVTTADIAIIDEATSSRRVAIAPRATGTDRPK